MIEYKVKVDDDKTKWFLNGKLHRIDGPACKYKSGTKKWYYNGEKHREDGPAVEYPNGYKEWWLNGKEVTEEEVMGNNVYKIENLLQMLLEEILSYGPNQPLKDTYIQERAKDIKKELKYNS